MWKRLKNGLLIVFGYAIAGYAGWEIYHAVAFGEIAGKRGAVYTWPEDAVGFIFYVAMAGLVVLVAVAVPVFALRQRLAARADAKRWRPTFDQAARAPLTPEMVDREDDEAVPPSRV